MLHPIKSDDGSQLEIRVVVFDLTNKEKEMFCYVLKDVKLPYGCASNVSRYVQVKERKLAGYKSHHAHFVLQYFLQFVTIQDYQKQHIAKKRGVHQLIDENDVNKSSMRRKLALDKDVTNGKKIRNSDKEVQDVAPKLNKYEELKRKQVA
ncbi:hypothetical protein POM88_029041 [Heracleum sosnowskyi]|uniref:Uncharacterized protein n=1 Tax=Heracleum sosnowskyi TaxID=360622 RepID=A0AAD8HTZ7_9APIA|nr:hypothetical protein POM88_029041 [Heracleum sosnowskyi]